MLDVQKELAKAVKHFWKTRADQRAKQGGGSGMKDAGNCSAVTGGSQTAPQLADHWMLYDNTGDEPLLVDWCRK